MADTQKKGLRSKNTFGFLDETGFSDRAIARYTWAKRGKTPVIPSKGGWKTRTVIGTLLCKANGERPRLVFTLQKKSVRAFHVVRYLDKLKKHFRGKKLTLFMDGLPAHRAKVVKQWIKENQSWLEVHRFPAYAPEYNPIELCLVRHQD